MEEVTARSPYLAGRGMARVRALVDELAQGDWPALLVGEPGVGKHLMAGEIVRASGRRDNPLVKFSCAAVGPALHEARLFGGDGPMADGPHPRDAGLIQRAKTGTLIISAIDRCSEAAQFKLADMLEGPARKAHLDVRVIAMTSEDLQRRVASAPFLQRLFYRLSAGLIEIPSLRSRRKEIADLARAFSEEIARERGRDPIRLEPAALRLLGTYRWPGGARELESVMRRCSLAGPGVDITIEHVQACLPARRGASREEIVRALRASKGIVSRAADLLAVSRQHFYRLLRQHGLKTRDGTGRVQPSDGQGVARHV